MITCEAFMAEFGSYLEGELVGEVRREIERHLAHCRTCEVLYDSTSKTLQIVSKSGSFDLPETAIRLIADKVMARIRKRPSI